MKWGAGKKEVQKPVEKGRGFGTRLFPPERHREEGAPFNSSDSSRGGVKKSETSKNTK